MLPFVFRFGVDKGRMWIMLIAIAFGIGAGLLSMDEGSAVSQLAARLTALPLWLLPPCPAEGRDSRSIFPLI